MNKLLRIISVLMLLIISRSVFASTSTSTDIIPATAGTQAESALAACKAITVDDIKTNFGPTPISFSTSVNSIPNSSQVICNVSFVWQQYSTSTSSMTGQLVRSYSTVYTCPSGYTNSDSSGVASSSGAYCSITVTSTVDDTCSELAASGGSVLGSGYFISGSSSSLCVQANSSYKCLATNTGSSLYFTIVSDTCSYGTAAGTYFYYTGAECDTVGSAGNNYSDGAAAAAACPLPTTDTTSSATTTDTASSATPTGCATITDGDTTLTSCETVSDTASSATPTGCATITDGDTTLTSCETVSDTGTTSSATTTTASTDTTSTTSTTSSAGNTYTTNNSTTTNNNSSSSNVTNNYNYAASAAESTDDSITTASTVTADYKDAISANDWSSRNYTTVLSDHISELKSSEIYSTASTFFSVNFSGGGCEPWGGTFELMGYSFTLSLDVCSFIAPYGAWMAAVVIFVCIFFAYRIAME